MDDEELTCQSEQAEEAAEARGPAVTPIAPGTPMPPLVAFHHLPSPSITFPHRLSW